MYSGALAYGSIQRVMVPGGKRRTATGLVNMAAIWGQLPLICWDFVCIFCFF